MTGKREGDQVLLLCIPGAGASAAKFERLRKRLSPAADVRTFELPGRGLRFGEKSFTTLTSHISHFVESVEREPYRRWIVLGESLGSVTACAVINQLLDSQRAQVLGFIAMSSAPKLTGHRPAHEVVASLRTESANQKVDDATYEKLSRPLVADIEAARATGAATLRIRRMDLPVVTLVGKDDGLVSEAAAREWKTKTNARWMFRLLPGDHYQLDSPSEAVVEALLEGVGFITGTGPGAEIEPD